MDPFCRLTNLGAVVSCDEESSVFLILPSPITLGGWAFSFSPSSTAVIELKNPARCLRAVVCRSLRSIGAFFGPFLSATIKSCSANRIVSRGSIACILQCAGKNLAEFDVRYPPVLGIKTDNFCSVS